ncbi:MAG: TatD family hydrolase [Hahellaceae bacterium]|nr:TatD family hydrolase [Hahellaceae bacterium]MCP5212192.1 TatD family hydrolase [Hahellaceae bacterium]
MFVDSHCHLDRLNLKHYEGSLDLALAKAREVGVSKMLCVCIDLEHLDDVMQIAEAHPDIYASVGVHPSHNDGEDPDAQRLVTLSRHEKVVAIGETGLDYFYGKDNKSAQKARFTEHLKAGSISKKPVIIHTRDAREDTIDLMSQYADKQSAGVMHCFTETKEMAEAALALNFYISFSGIITFKNADDLREVVKYVPIERLLIETDSPYLAPVPYRGKSNEPAYVSEVAKQVASLKGLSVEDVARITSDNFTNLFGV